MELATLIERGRAALPGGVCSTVRHCNYLDRPLYFIRGKGAHIVTSDGKEMTDMCMSHGASLLGHGHPFIREAIIKALEMGVLCSADTPFHVELAEKIVTCIPCAEMVRFTNSGTEATLHALRLCRSFSGRNKIIRFLGHFHGYHEYVYIGGHPPKEALDNPSKYKECAGIPDAMTEFVISIPCGDLNLLEEILKKNKDEVGTVILEPVNYNNGCILYSQEYLQGLRRLTKEYDVLLFFDEIQSSFKKSIGGAQQDFGVIPDICTIGKSLGGGVPLSAICGRKEIMSHFKPIGRVQHSGTFNAHLISILAGLAFLEEVSKNDFYKQLELLEDYFYPELEKLFVTHHSGFHIQHHGARFGIFADIGYCRVESYMQTIKHNKKKMLNFYRAMYDRGVFFCDYGGGPAHHGFSAAHLRNNLANVLEMAEDALHHLQKE